MHRIALSLTVLLLACADGDDAGVPVGAGGTSEQETTGVASETTAPSPDPTDPSSISASASGTTSSAGTTTLDTAEGSSSSSESDGGPGCPVGGAGCPCDEGACDDGLSCVEDICSARSSCDEDLLEPNDDEAMPTLLGEINDNDGNGSSIFGTLDGPDDVDWYRYTGDDDITGNVDPARFVDANAIVRLCKFAECENGLEHTEFDCPPETEVATSPLGRPGCCAAQGVALGDANCTGVLEDNMDVYMRVDQGGAACVDYELIYHF